MNLTSQQGTALRGFAICLIVAVALAWLCFVTGCSTPWPKDAYIKNAEITTPWTGTAKVEVMATGAAAKNLTESERRELLTPAPRAAK
jgi:hypothetical protein